VVNILLFLVSTIVYFTLWCIVTNKPQKSIRQRLKELAIVALLCLPLNINGSVFTVLGNIESSKNVFSLFSVYQRAENDAHSLFGSIVQEAGHDASVLVGLTGYQKAGNEASILVGVAGYQEAKNISGVLLGVSGVQESGRAYHIVGLVGYQKATDLSGVLCCFAGIQHGNNSAGLLLGLVIYQASQKESATYLSMALYQKVREQDRSFAIWSQLKIKEQKEK